MDFFLAEFYCYKCRRSYKSKGALSRHLKYECESKHIFRCVYCTKSVKQKYNLKDHVRRRHPEKTSEFQYIYNNYV